MKPVIGLNVDISGTAPKTATVQADYYEAISKAGGVPVLLPPVDNEELRILLGQISGLLFVGGDDYCPSLYAEKPNNKNVPVHPDRMDFDLRLLTMCLKETALPILGICGGCQLLNIGLGGSLMQHIPEHLPDSKVNHASPNGWQKGFNKHLVSIKPGSKLSQIYASNQINVVTSHHQAINKPGKDLSVVAQAEDGVIEAIELANKPFVIGVQWHPERDYPNNKKLFEAFINEAKSPGCNPSKALAEQRKQ